MGLCINHIRYFGTLWWEDYTVISVLKSVLAFSSFKCTLLSVDAFPNTAQTLCLSTKCWFHPIFPSKTVMNGAICTLLSWQNTPILLLGRQKAANNNRRIWQFKRSIKATPRLTIKAVSPFKDGSKDPFASLLFWGIELYKFRVKESCFFSRVWFGVFKEEEEEKKAPFLIQFASGAFMTRACVTCEWQSEECRRASTEEERGRELHAGSKGTAKEGFLGRKSLVRRWSPWFRWWPPADVTQHLPDRPRAVY